MLRIYIQHFLRKVLLIATLACMYSENSFADTILIKSNDEVNITATTYIVNDEPKTPIIVLFHQAGWSRGEYIDIAPKLNQLGFNCIAVDLRSGESINDVDNLTAKHANKLNKSTRYIDALPDVLSSLQYVNKHFPESEVIAWGSSYSAALVLNVAGTHPQLIDGAISFAPGEYFSKQGKSNTWIQETAATIDIPIFITSAKNEEKNWSDIYNSIESNKKTSFIPNTKGNHGSRALWDSFADSEDYWQAVITFLKEHF
ncbi:MAG: alpha/beta hydrolase [Gammaproteobacteria bacterium]